MLILRVIDARLNLDSYHQNMYHYASDDIIEPSPRTQRVQQCGFVLGDRLDTALIPVLLLCLGAAAIDRPSPMVKKSKVKIPSTRLNSVFRQKYLVSLQLSSVPPTLSLLIVLSARVKIESKKIRGKKMKREI